MEHGAARRSERKHRTRAGPRTVEIGSDNNYEYKLRGYFSGDKVYELVSNRILPEFVLQGYE